MLLWRPLSLSSQAKILPRRKLSSNLLRLSRLQLLSLARLLTKQRHKRLRNPPHHSLLPRNP